jgi:hypothetical protein
MRLHRRTPALLLPAFSVAGILSVALLAGCEGEGTPLTPAAAQQAKEEQEKTLTKFEKEASGKGKAAVHFGRKPGAVGTPGEK